MFSFKKKKNKIIFKIIDIKTNKEIWFQKINTYSIFYKTTSQIVHNEDLVRGVCSVDASILGVVCGEIYRENLVKKIQKISSPLNLIEYEPNSYNILSIDRTFNVSYEDLNKEIFCKNLLSLVQEKEIIAQFTPINSYYLGFLSGIELYKIKHKLITPRKQSPPKLTLVHSKS